jgi:hypothetical protein
MALVLLCATPVAAASRQTDSEAFATYYSEWSAQEIAVATTVGAYIAAPSSTEKSQAGTDARAAIVETDKRMSRLELRECFSTIARLATIELDALTAAFDVDIDPVVFSFWLGQAGAASQAINGQLKPTLLACAE